MSITPTNIRDLCFRDIKARLHGLRASVYEALLEHGPMTTRALADASGMCILTVRPRVTELFQLGFAVLVIDDTCPHLPREGVFRALTAAEAETVFLERQAAAHDPQQTFELACP